MSKDLKHLVVVGGGITGLSAAYYAVQKARELDQRLHVTVVEKSGRLGGSVHTLRKDGFVIERGPDSFLSRKLPIIELSQSLGLESEFAGLNPDAKKSYILRYNKLHGMPPGLMLGIPYDDHTFMDTELLSQEGKARVAQELQIPKRVDMSDESLGSFVERRLGKEMLENIVEPLLAGIYAGDLSKLSLQATYPQFHQLEQQYGSIIKGTGESRNQTAASAELPEYAKKSAFLTYKNGLSTLIQALTESLGGAGVDFLQETAVQSVQPADGGVTIHLTRGEQPSELQADAVIFAVPAFQLAKLLSGYPKVEKLGSMEYVSVANVVLAYKQKQLHVKNDGTGFLIPRTEGRFITACTWTSVKWPHTAEEGDTLIRCYVGRAGDQRHLEMTDEEIQEQVKADVFDLMGIEAEPDFITLTRLNRAMPQYPVGHLTRIREAREELLQAIPNARMTGAAFEGVGLPDCIRQGRDTARELVESLWP
ncbi:protoporphyrinogen oxidase [Marinicrinis lubricantis]|uniref:Coproporphyrinogen III oxidase n=1 Tax=Marinicrinis lubricantis TaxID=2086470 RepID=A0ABW1IU08_9BACL